MKRSGRTRFLPNLLKELKSAILDQGDADDEFKKAIGENIVVLARYKARIERLVKEIEELLDMQCVSGAAAGSHGGGPSSMDMQPEGGALTEAEASRSSGEVANAVAVAAEAGVHLRADPVPSPGQDTDMEGMYL